VLRKRQRIAKVLDGFDPQKIARYDAKKDQTSCSDPGIIRIASKLQHHQQRPSFPEVQQEIRQLRQYILAIHGRKAQTKRWKRKLPARNENLRHPEQTAQTRLPLRRLEILLRANGKATAW